MFQRGVSNDDVLHVLATGEDIEVYPSDMPYPSRLLLGRSGVRPLHVVVSDNAQDLETVVITVYEPDPNLWSEDFRSRR